MHFTGNRATKRSSRTSPAPACERAGRRACGRLRTALDAAPRAVAAEARSIVFSPDAIGIRRDACPSPRDPFDTSSAEPEPASSSPTSPDSTNPTFDAMSAPRSNAPSILSTVSGFEDSLDSPKHRSPAFRTTHPMPYVTLAPAVQFPIRSFARVDVRSDRPVFRQAVPGRKEWARLGRARSRSGVFIEVFQIGKRSADRALRRGRCGVRTLPGWCLYAPKF